MKFFSLFALLAAPLAISATRVSWAYYDNPKMSLYGVACGDGPNGLIRKGYKTLGDLRTFPDVAGSYVGKFNSPGCGSCWRITYQGRTVTVTVVDSAGEGFNLSKAALNYLTNGRAENGAIDATAVEVDRSNCY